MRTSERPGPCPSVLGHEAVGEVVAVGSDAPVPVGTRVVWGVTVACGACDRCRAGRSAKCRKVRKIGHEPFDSAWPLSGAYAEHVLLPRGATVVPVAEGLPDVVAAPAACATATVVAALAALGEVRGARVLVSGAGMLGLTAVAAAVDAGAAEVVVTDVSPARLALAASFGATAAVIAGEALPVVDVAVELSGASDAVAAGLEALDVGGRLVLAGSVSPAAPVPLDPERVVRRWLSITGVHNYEPHHLAGAVALLERTPHLPWTRLVASAVPLDQLAQLLTDTDRATPRAAVDLRTS